MVRLSVCLETVFTDLPAPERIDALGYQGCFGLEYFPRMSDPTASLEAIRRHLILQC